MTTDRQEKPTQGQVEELMSDIVLPFYEVERDMLLPRQPDGLMRNERDAEHSWSVAVLACSLAHHIDPKLDVGLVCQFSILHDIVEVYAGDTSNWADSAALEAKSDNEADALNIIAKKFPHFPWLVEIATSYEHQDTDEALYVRAIDKYIALCIRFMDGGEFYRSRGITKNMFDSAMASHRQKAHGHPGAAEYYEMIRQEYDLHPEHFHSV